MFFFSVKLTLFVLCFIPISGLIISSIGKKLKRQSSKIQKDLVLDKYQNHLELKITTFESNYYFYYRLKSNDLWEILDSCPINLLSHINSPLQISLFTSSDNQPTKNYAAFDLFRYYDLKQ